MTCIICYLPAIYIFKRYIDSLDINTKIWLSEKLKISWSIWCFSLSLFSLFGTLYTGKYIFIDRMTPKIFETEYELWYNLFIVSKIPELLDTFFIIARSKKLVALQYYHHFVTLVISFYSWKYLCSKIVIFIFMNYFVHFFMYFYFGLYCYVNKNKYIKMYGTFVNIIQTLQMIIAVILGVYLFYNECDFECKINLTNNELNSIIYSGIVMYISYFILFILLFFERNERIKKKYY